MNGSDPGDDLARWAAQGDRAALERALAAAADPARAQALRLLGRAADADDATQEALVQLVRSARRYDPARPFRPWLARLVHDACCRLLRSDRRRRRHEAATPPPSPTVEPAVDTEAVRAAVLALPEPLRAAVDLHYFAGLSQAEAAEALGIGEGACAMRLSRARERLRTLLTRRGVGLGAGAALALLAATPAPAAAPALATGIAAQAAAGTLPATTIPLTPLQTGTWFMATHPLATTAIALGLTAAAIAPLALTAVEPAPPAPPAPVPAPRPAPAPGYTPGTAATALLPYLDPAAPLRVALDLQTMRPQLVQAKPFTLLSDPAMAPLLQEGRAWLDKPVARGDDSRFWVGVMVRLAEHGRAATLAMRDGSQIRRPEEGILAMADAGPAGEAVAAAFLDLKRTKRLREEGTPAPVASFVPLIREDRSLFLGHDQALFTFANEAWLGTRIGATPAAPPPAAAWFRCDLSPLISAIAGNGGRDRRGTLGALFGERWDQARPQVEGSIGVDGQELVAETHGRDDAGQTAFVPLVGYVQHLMGAMLLQPGPSWPLRSPRLGIPASPDALASLALGLTPPAGAEPLTRVERGWLKLTALQRRELIRQTLAAAWSGDLAAEVRSGEPLPRLALVLGLRPGTEPTAAARQAAVMLGIPEDGGDGPATLPVTFRGGKATGSPAITAHPDRLVLTWNAGPEAWPGIATGGAGMPEVVCAVRADLPAAVRSCWPLVLMGMPEDLRGRLPPPAAIAAHLPVWTMACRLTIDGWRIEERGLPLATVSTAAIACQTLATSRPAAKQAPQAAPAAEKAPAF